MKKTDLRTPLIQSAALLGGMIVLFTIVASSGSTSAGGGIVAAFTGLGNAIVFVIGMALSLAVSISILVAIFLAAVAMVSPEQASQMYTELKKNFSKNLLTLKDQFSCCENQGSATGISEEDYNQMKQEIEQLRGQNQTLNATLKQLKDDKTSLQSTFNELSEDNLQLTNKIEGLADAIKVLETSELEIKKLVDELSLKISSGTDESLKENIKKLEELQLSTQAEIEKLNERLQAVEIQFGKPADNDAPPTPSGIFAYLENNGDQLLFIEKVKEALAQDFTYAKIDEYLTTTLPAEVDTIIKDHPSLTKKYIRSLRSE